MVILPLFCGFFLFYLCLLEALAGVPVESIRGSRTAVFGASMTDDYVRMVCKDPDTVLRQTVIGTAPTSLPNRVSWFFDLRGPSVHVNTACSSSLIALDLACQSIRCGDADSVSLVFTISISIFNTGNTQLFTDTQILG